MTPPHEPFKKLFLKHKMKNSLFLENFKTKLIIDTNNETFFENFKKYYCKTHNTIFLNPLFEKLVKLKATLTQPAELAG